jgi:methionine--tRNA ligase beta chain
MINIEEFAKIELKTAKVLEAERVEGSEKLIKLSLDVGDKNEAGEFMPRQVLAGIGKTYNPEDLVGKQIVIVANLEPRSLMGLESHGMIVAGSDDQGVAIVSPDRELPTGTILK